MVNLLALLGIAPSSEVKKQEIKQNSNSIMFEIRRKINEEVPFTLVYLDLARQDGRVVGDTKYISDLVGGETLNQRCIGVLVPLGKYQSVYDKLEKLSEAPFPSELRIGYASFPGRSEEDRHLIGDLMVEAQNYKSHRRYAGKLPPKTLGEKVLECAG